MVLYVKVKLLLWTVNAGYSVEIWLNSRAICYLWICSLCVKINGLPFIERSALENQVRCCSGISLQALSACTAVNVRVKNRWGYAACAFH